MTQSNARLLPHRRALIAAVLITAYGLFILFAMGRPRSVNAAW